MLWLRGAARGAQRVQLQLLSRQVPAFQSGHTKRLLQGALLVQALTFFVSNVPDPSLQARMRDHWQYSWKGVVVEGRWWTLCTAHVHHKELEHLLTNAVSLCVSACLLQSVLRLADWALLMTSASLLSSSASLCWAYYRHGPCEAKVAVAFPGFGSQPQDWWSEVAAWLSSFSEFCYLRRIELKSGVPGQLTQRLTGPANDTLCNPSPSCPGCGVGMLVKAVVRAPTACGRCGALQAANSAMLTCDACGQGCCGTCVAALGLLPNVADLVRLYQPYEVWAEKSSRGSLGSSSIVQSIMAAAGCWTLHLLAMRHRGVVLLVVPAVCVCQPLHDAAILWRSSAGVVAEADTDDIAVAHLSGFAVGVVFYALRIARRDCSQLLCFPLARLR